MKVLFIQDVSGTAYAGDVKEVKNGFARNYLLPQKLAVPATADQMNRVKRLQTEAAKRREVTEAGMKEIAGKLNGATITIEARAGRNNRLYGAITNAMVAEEIAKLAGREIERRRVIMDPIRQLGAYQVPVKLHQGIEPKITLVVAAPGGKLEEEATAEEVVEQIKGEEKQEPVPAAAEAAPAEEQAEQEAKAE